MKVVNPLRKLLGFLLIWGLGLWPHLPLPLLVTAAGVSLFFIALPVIARWVGAGGYRELGLFRHPGWDRNLLLGFGLGCLLPLGLFAAQLVTGGLAPLGWVEWPDLLLRGLWITLNTCYIGFWEELLSRGYLLRVLPPRLSRTTTLLAVGLVFSLFHLPRFGAPAPWWAFWFISGIMFAIPVLSSGSLWFSVGVHWGLDLLWFALLVDDGLLRYGPAGTAALNSGTPGLLAVLLFLPLIWWIAPRLAKASHLMPSDRSTATRTQAADA